MQEACELDTTNNRQEYFAAGGIQYEGPDSLNPLSFKYYNASEIIMGKPMKEWLRFSLAYWHTMRGDGSDPFGSATRYWPWEDAFLSPIAQARKRMEVFFEILSKLGVEYWCFHDRDISPEGSTPEETDALFDEMVAYAEEMQKATGIKVLWGTAQLFKHPKYAQGAATSPNPVIFAHAARQVAKAMQATKKLGGKAFVFWGGREGYSTLLNTDLKLELDNLSRFMHMAVNYKKLIRFDGQLLLEPKPQEPTHHQYDWDVATTSAFLLRYGLDKDFKLNIECNHATLAGHSCYHEVEMARMYDAFGSLDANTGSPQVGWDTDQFLTDVTEATLLASAILRQGGLAPGGINFDAKLRRESTDPNDILYGHIIGMDTLARGLRNAARMIEEGHVDALKAKRYHGWKDTELGQKIVEGKLGFKELMNDFSNQEVELQSGGEELFHMWMGRYAA